MTSRRQFVSGPVPFKETVYAAGVAQGFADFGYRDGSRMQLEYRSADGREDLYRRQARELVDLNCDLYIVLGAEAPVRILQELKPRAPIVFLAVDYDPLERKIVSDLRRPDRNTTGVYVPQNSLVAKRMEVLREALPAAKRVVVFADRFSSVQVPGAHQGARSARFEVSVVEFSQQPYDYAGQLDSARKSGADAFMTLASPVFARERQAISEILLRNRMPGIGTATVQAEAGYLLALGTLVPKVTRRLADVGVRLLKGARPADIPVEQADEFELTINAKTAKALGIRIPESVLARASRIVS